MENKKFDPDRPKRIAGKVKELSDFFYDRQQYHAKKAQDFGYSGEVLRDISSTIEKTTDDPTYFNLEVSMDKWKLLVHSTEMEAETKQANISSTAYAFGTAVSATAGFNARDDQSFIFKLESLKPPESWSSDRMEQYAKRLEKLDLELGKLSRSVWQSFYGGAENAERAALLSMRQLYDHFFQIIAPDEKVRDSIYFTKKQKDNANQVHRKERINYAANNSISNKQLSEFLESQADYVLNVYAKLNKIHKRGILNKKETREILSSMQTIIEEWVDAIDL